MEIFDNLASVGLTTGVLQIIIVAGAVLLIAGMFWKYLLAGLGIAFTVAVFAMPSKKIDKAIEVVVPATPPVVSQTLKPEEEVVEVIPDQSEKGMFMTDCQKYGGYTASQCVALWNDRENDKVRYRKATNKMFMLKTKHQYTL